MQVVEHQYRPVIVSLEDKLEQKLDALQKSLLQLSGEISTPRRNIANVL